MNDIDVNEQWSNLQELYGGMAEEELQAVADDGYHLTDIARQALRAEISRRHLDIVLNETPPPSDHEDEPHGDFDPANLTLVTAFRVWDVAEARRVKEALDAAYIPSYLGPDNIENVDRLPPITESGVAVRVREGDGQRARFATRGARTSREEDEDEVPEYVAHCPKCHSEEIVFEGLGDAPPHHDDTEDLDLTDDDVDFDAEEEREQEEAEEQEVANPDSPANAADANAKYNWRCDACGHKWQDDGVEPSQ